MKPTATVAELAFESGIGSGQCSVQQLAVEPGQVAAASAGQAAAGVQVVQSAAVPPRRRGRPAKKDLAAKGKKDTAK